MTNSVETLPVGALLFGSGFCALVYQIGWLRELRLVFGASTAASAAVLAIFMGGLGLGSAILGKVADRRARPLRFYAVLELLIAVAAFASPFLILLVRRFYVLLGGSLTLGMGLATAVRLGLAAIVLGVPTFLMGGTLPAAARAVETPDDVGRSHLALLYGLNTLGAVAGAACCAFYFLEIFGTRQTLWLAALFNLLVAVAAWSLSRRFGISEEPERPQTAPCAPEAARAPTAYVLAAAAAVGFAFFLMELVWYRMLSPLLGGTTYTFGLILTVALAGIGLGGAIYAGVMGRRPGTMNAFALTVGIEAVCMALPYALGDRIAILTSALTPLSAMGFAGQVAGWALVACIVVLPAAVISGFQFPLLIALLGSGESHVGRQTGWAYAANTAGAIAGSLAGGFGLLPLLSAPGVWRAVVALLVAVGVLALATAFVRKRGDAIRAVGPAAALILAVLLIALAEGPSATWRHSSVGVGRSTLDLSSKVDLKNSIHQIRRHVVWEADGVESSVALLDHDGLAFSINGKIDGNAREDVPTQVMLGMVGAALHPDPRRALVVGLGTGSSAGWLARVDSIDRVDVVELEPAILDVARQCSLVNEDALDNPKLAVHVADAREVLLTTPDTYDLIISEPSNPYRAGIASLYTCEFYESVAARLTPNGSFSQWVQAYEVDSQTVCTIYATLASVFAYVTTWQTDTQDLLLVCTQEEPVVSVAALRERLAREPFRAALTKAWRVTDLEGFLSRHVARPALAQAVAGSAGARLNTDDRTLVEYGFARTVGKGQDLLIDDMIRMAREQDLNRPKTCDGAVDWPQVEEQRLHMFLERQEALFNYNHLETEQRQRILALFRFTQEDVGRGLHAWREQPGAPGYLTDVALLAEALAEESNTDAVPLMERLRQEQPIEADVIEARLLWRQGDNQGAAEKLARAFEAYRTDPWPMPQIMERALRIAAALAKDRPDTARRLALSLSRPFAVHCLELRRRHTALEVASDVNDLAFAAPFLEAFEPYVPWEGPFLEYRLACYAALGHRRAPRAAAELRAYLRDLPLRFRDALDPPAAP